MNAPTKKALLAVLMLLPGLASQAADFSGFADAYYAFGLHGDREVMSERSRLRLDLEENLGDAYLFASLNAVHNDRLDDESEVSLHEAYMDYASDSWNIRVGRQIIVWGNADGVQITDLVCPVDMTEFLTREFDDIRMPVTAAKFNWYHDQADVELVWIPVFEPAVFPEGDNPWAVCPSRPGVKTVAFDAKEPSRTLDNGELAGRVSFFTSGFDFAVSALSVWDDSPVMKKTLAYGANGPVMTLRPEYHRMGVIGGEFSRPVEDFVVRGEAAFKRGRYFAVENGDPLERNTLTALLGLDWYPGNDWTVITQLVDDYVFNHDPDLDRGPHQVTLTLNVSKKFLREMLTISNMIYCGITRDEVFDRLSAEYALTDDLHVFCGLDAFQGDRDEGSFGPYRDKDQVWLKAKYSF